MFASLFFFGTSHKSAKVIKQVSAGVVPHWSSSVLALPPVPSVGTLWIASKRMRHHQINTILAEPPTPVRSHRTSALPCQVWDILRCGVSRRWSPRETACQRVSLRSLLMVLPLDVVATSDARNSDLSRYQQLSIPLPTQSSPSNSSNTQ